MTIETSESHSTLIELRQQARYWRTQHSRAVQREGVLKEKIEQLEKVIKEQEDVISQQAEEIERLNGRAAWLEQQLFGRKSEQAKGSESKASDNEEQDGETPEGAPDARRKRGKQRGTKGYGRKRRTSLRSKEIPHDLPEEERRCPKCGKPFESFPGTEDSEEIHWEVHIIRHIHKRARYRRTCKCKAVPGIVTAPPPAKLIPKGLFSSGFWVRLMMEKFLFQRPLYRVRKVLELEGLWVSQGTLTGGLKRIGELLTPLYGQILKRSRMADHWHMDETRWMVFVEVEGKTGHRWWLWVVVTQDSCVYLLDPSRSASVPKNHLGEDAEGIISADRYSVYKSLGENIQVAFCWTHTRRDFFKISKGKGALRAWAEEWMARIGNLYRLNRNRLVVQSDPEAFGVEDQKLRDAIASMEEAREQELADDTLHTLQRKALESMRNHWGGLTLFVDHPEIPMDNSEAERRLRNPVVGRKNYYGSGSLWSGMLTAMLFTIFQTLLLNHINPQKFLLAYFQACAENGGRAPDDIDAFLPWNLSEELRAAWLHPDRPP